MIAQIAYTQIIGLPIVAWLGILTLILLLITATIGLLNSKGNHAIPFKWHPIMAKTAITIALIHAIFAASLYLGY